MYFQGGSSQIVNCMCGQGLGALGFIPGRLVSRVWSPKCLILKVSGLPTTRRTKQQLCSRAHGGLLTKSDPHVIMQPGT